MMTLILIFANLFAVGEQFVITITGEDGEVACRDAMNFNNKIYLTKKDFLSIILPIGADIYDLNDHTSWSKEIFRQKDPENPYEPYILAKIANDPNKSVFFPIATYLNTEIEDRKIEVLQKIEVKEGCPIPVKSLSNGIIKEYPLHTIKAFYILPDESRIAKLENHLPFLKAKLNLLDKSDSFYINVSELESNHCIDTHLFNKDYFKVAKSWSKNNTATNTRKPIPMLSISPQMKMAIRRIESKNRSFLSLKNNFEATCCKHWKGLNNWSKRTEINVTNCFDFYLVELEKISRASNIPISIFFGIINRESSGSCEAIDHTDTFLGLGQINKDGFPQDSDSWKDPIAMTKRIADYLREKFKYATGFYPTKDYYNLWNKLGSNQRSHWLRAIERYNGQSDDVKRMNYVIAVRNYAANFDRTATYARRLPALQYFKDRSL